MTWIDSLALSILMSYSNLLGVHNQPNDMDGWKIIKEWDATGKQFLFTAESSSIVHNCKQHPQAYLKFPIIVHSGYELFLDGQLIRKGGNLDVAEGAGYYTVPELKCSEIKNGKILMWNIYSYSKYFSRFNFFPKIQNSKPITNFFSRTLSLAVGACFSILGIFSFLIFWHKIPNRLAFYLLFSNLFLSFYFLFSVTEMFPITFSIMAVHKYGLIGLWIGILLLFKAFELEALISRFLSNFFIYFVMVGIAITAISDTPDTIQLGTHIIFIPALTVILSAIYRLVVKSKSKRESLLQFIGLFILVCCSINDMLLNSGLGGVPLFSIGVFGAQYFFVLSVNEKIRETYHERDYLRLNLEKEVERKTIELKTVQAELIQAAKLASLGTLAAGIAHEINNSINYVNGAIAPLEKILNQNIKEDVQKLKIQKLFDIMKDGVHLTIDIINSLRNYTGLNQAKFNEVTVKNAVNSSLTILRSKTRNNITVNNQIPENIIIFGSVVGLNQIFMNLISNAIDAMPNGGTLTLSAAEDPNNITITVADTGEGIPIDKIDQIFDPFFTTKPAGKGTGIGLHIVVTEIKKHKGTIKVKSEFKNGTEFIITLPKAFKNEAA